MKLFLFYLLVDLALAAPYLLPLDEGKTSGLTSRDDISPVPVLLSRAAAPTKRRPRTPPITSSSNSKGASAGLGRLSATTSKKVPLQGPGKAVAKTVGSQKLAAGLSTSRRTSNQPSLKSTNASKAGNLAKLATPSTSKTTTTAKASSKQAKNKSSTRPNGQAQAAKGTAAGGRARATPLRTPTLGSQAGLTKRPQTLRGQSTRKGAVNNRAKPSVKATAGTKRKAATNTQKAKQTGRKRLCRRMERSGGSCSVEDHPLAVPGSGGQYHPLATTESGDSDPLSRPGLGEPSRASSSPRRAESVPARTEGGRQSRRSGRRPAPLNRLPSLPKDTKEFVKQDTATPIGLIAGGIGGSLGSGAAMTGFTLGGGTKAAASAKVAFGLGMGALPCSLAAAGCGMVAAYKGYKRGKEGAEEVRAAHRKADDAQSRASSADTKASAARSDIELVSTKADDARSRAGAASSEASSAGGQAGLALQSVESIGQALSPLQSSRSPSTLQKVGTQVAAVTSDLRRQTASQGLSRAGREATREQSPQRQRPRTAASAPGPL